MIVQDDAYAGFAQDAIKFESEGALRAVFGAGTERFVDLPYQPAKENIPLGPIFQVVFHVDSPNSYGCSRGLANPNRTGDTAFVVMRGQCSFLDKAVAAAGAASLIVVVDTPEGQLPRPTLSTEKEVNNGLPLLVLVPFVGLSYLREAQHIKFVKTPRMWIYGQRVDNLDILTSLQM